jgi:DNA-binding response OmpR family regulator
MKVLVAENDEEIARLIAQGLRERGDDVDVGGDGDEATRLATRSVYGAIVLEAGLPSRNGFQVARDLRRAGQTVPILILTAPDSAEDAVRGLDSGADDYLPKPFGFDQLLARIGVIQGAGRSRSVSTTREEPAQAVQRTPSGIGGVAPGREQT